MPWYNGFKPIKEIFRRKLGKQTQKRPFLSATWEYRVYDDKLYLVASEEPEIHVFDQDGNAFDTLSFNYEQNRFTQADEHEFFEFLKKYRPPRFYEAFKRIVVFPDYFPAVQDFRVDDGKIYILTYKRDKANKQSEFLVLNLKGRIVKTVYLPFHRRSPIHPSPFAIKNNKLFQLVDNIDSETWELHISGI